MYTNTDFQTKKALREAVASGQHVTVYSLGPFPAKIDGEEFVEGPHYPKPHTWYASVVLENGVIVKVK
jgi:hypothetical protein